MKRIRWVSQFRMAMSERELREPQWRFLPNSLHNKAVVEKELQTSRSQLPGYNTRRVILSGSQTGFFVKLLRNYKVLLIFGIDVLSISYTVLATSD